MIRGLHIYFLLLALDAVRVFFNPLLIHQLLLGIVLGPFYCSVLMTAPRMGQNLYIARGASLARASDSLRLAPGEESQQKGPYFFIWMKLFDLLTEQEATEMFGPPPPGLGE